MGLMGIVEGHVATSISNGITEIAGIMGWLLRAIRSAGTTDTATPYKVLKSPYPISRERSPVLAAGPRAVARP